MELDLHFTPGQVAIALALSAVGEIIGKILVSIFGDHLPCRNLYVVVVTHLLGAVAAGIVTLLRTIPLMYAYSFGEFSAKRVLLLIHALKYLSWIGFASQISFSFLNYYFAS